jgi:uncharacterized repeat protein (TIGR01451 family)
MNMNRIQVAGVLLLAAFAGAAFPGVAAPQAAGVAIDTAAYQEVQVKAEDGSTRVERVTASRVVPGGEVIYEITYRNNGSAAATNVAIDNPLPAEVQLVGTSTEPTVVSVDHGRTFAKLGELSVVAADGSVRTAQLADVTNLRWVIADLEPGAEGKVSYRARVK